MTHLFDPLFAAHGSPLLMGVVNVTPDSFSDGGGFMHADDAIAHGRALAKEGAVILDIGGESTRPGAQPIPPEEEMRRVLPVLKGLLGVAPFISIDTRHAITMHAALEAGANMINDISALSDPRAPPLLATSPHVALCLMHMQGTPATMQNAPLYDDAPRDIALYLKERLEMCKRVGIAPSRICLDPGIGFGKTLAHNISLLKAIPRFVDIGCPVLIGVSRKSFIAGLSKGESAADRLPGSLAAALYASRKGASVLRVHDVAATRQALWVHKSLES